MTDSGPTPRAPRPFDVDRFDPDHLLQTLSLALGDDEKPTSSDLTAAAALLQKPGALAYAYSLIDIAVRMATATGMAAADAERYADSPLATLLDSACEDEFDDDSADVGTDDNSKIDDTPSNVVAIAPAPHPEQRPVAANDDDDDLGGGAKIIRLFGPAAGLLAAAAALLFFVQSPETDGPGVKGGPTAAAVSAQIVAREGPLAEAQLRGGVDRTRKNIEACGIEGPAVVDLGFAILGSGVVDSSGDNPITSTIVQGNLDKTQLHCLQQSIRKAAFDFQRDPTLVMMRLEFSERAAPSLVPGARPK